MISVDFNIATDSRKIAPGSIFIALSGHNHDGHEYISSAISNGAIYIVAEKYPEEIGINGGRLLTQYADESPTIATFELDNGQGQLVIWDVVKSSRLAYANWARQRFPKQPEHVVAVTGTNGKTSTAWFYQQILALLERPSAFIGTLGALSNVPLPEEITKASLTTPDPLLLHEQLDSMTDAGVKYVAIEASSHALDQNRLVAVKFKAAAFTNFTQDHLDYHHDMESYFQAKQKLFNQLLSSSAVAVLNKDIPQFPQLMAICAARGIGVITYGASEADITGHVQELGIISLRVMGRQFSIKFKPVGDFQVYNLMAAIGLLIAVGVAIEEIISVISKLYAPLGRMELVATHNNGAIYIDYAHTPDALMRVLQAQRVATSGRLFVVFGCGGNRDAEKRPLMGEIANTYADVVVITDDNPRLEDPAKIRNDILSACSGALEIANRETAIAYAVAQLEPGDSLLIAGKGHENYQIIGNEILHFSDHEQVLKNIN